MNSHIFSCHTCIQIKMGMLKGALLSYRIFFLARGYLKKLPELASVLLWAAKSISQLRRLSSSHHPQIHIFWLYPAKYERNSATDSHLQEFLLQAVQNNMNICFNHSLAVAHGNPEISTWITSESVSTLINSPCLSFASLVNKISMEIWQGPVLFRVEEQFPQEVHQGCMKSA